MKLMPIKIITLLILLCVSSFAFADANHLLPNSVVSSFTSSSLFTISPSDISVNMLMRLLGSVGSVLPGSPGLLDALFKQFNWAILFVMVLTVIAYTLFRAIVETAHHGEFLGKKLDSLWVPIRVVAGIILVSPTVGGYCIIQVIVMWVVLQGVGAADNIWKTALLYFQNNNNTIVTPPHQEANNVTANGTGQNILAGLVCMYDAAQKDGVKYDAPELQPKFNDNGNPNNSVVFSYKSSQCGNIQWKNPAYITDAKAKLKAEVVQNAMETLIGKLNLNAKNMVYLNSDQSGYNPVAIAAGYLNSSVYAEADHNNDSQQLSDQIWRTAYDNGWAMAGSYYYTIASQMRAATMDSTLSNSDIQGSICVGATGGQGGSTPSPSAPAAGNACKMTNPLLVQMWNATSGGEFQDNPDDIFSNGHIAKSMESDFDPLSLTIIYPTVVAINNDFNSEILHKLNDNENPVVTVSNFGQTILDNVQCAITGMTYGLPALAAIMGICIGMNPGILIMIVQLLISWPLLTAIFGGMFIIGLTLAVYIPMVPYIIFFFGVLGWLLAVLESIIAAPLVALGVTYPEGHEMFGRADPALMLLANIFLRPSLLLFGLFAGMLVTYIGVSFVNSTFVPVIGTVMSGRRIHPLEFMFILIIYSGILTVLLNKSFNLIHMIPDQVLRWIGGQGAQFGEYGGGEQEVKGISSSGSSQLKAGMDAQVSKAQEGFEATGSAAQGQQPSNGGGGGGEDYNTESSGSKSGTGGNSTPPPEVLA